MTALPSLTHTRARGGAAPPSPSPSSSPLTGTVGITGRDSVDVLPFDYNHFLLNRIRNEALLKKAGFGGGGASSANRIDNTGGMGTPFSSSPSSSALPPPSPPRGVMNVHVSPRSLGSHHYNNASLSTSSISGGRRHAGGSVGGGASTPAPVASAASTFLATAAATPSLPTLVPSPMSTLRDVDGASSPSSSSGRAPMSVVVVGAGGGVLQYDVVYNNSSAAARNSISAGETDGQNGSSTVAAGRGVPVAQLSPRALFSSVILNNTSSSSSSARPSSPPPAGKVLFPPPNSSSTPRRPSAVAIPSPPAATLLRAGTVAAAAAPSPSHPHLRPLAPTPPTGASSPASAGLTMGRASFSSALAHSPSASASLSLTSAADYRQLLQLGDEEALCRAGIVTAQQQRRVTAERLIMYTVAQSVWPLRLREVVGRDEPMARQDAVLLREREERAVILGGFAAGLTACWEAEEAAKRAALLMVPISPFSNTASDPTVTLQLGSSGTADAVGGVGAALQPSPQPPLAGPPAGRPRVSTQQQSQPSPSRAETDRINSNREVTAGGGDSYDCGVDDNKCDTCDDGQGRDDWRLVHPQLARHLLLTTTRPCADKEAHDRKVVVHQTEPTAFAAIAALFQRELEGVVEVKRQARRQQERLEMYRDMNRSQFARIALTVIFEDVLLREVEERETITRLYRFFSFGGQGGIIDSVVPSRGDKKRGVDATMGNHAGLLPVVPAGEDAAEGGGVAEGEEGHAELSPVSSFDDLLSAYYGDGGGDDDLDADADIAKEEAMVAAGGADAQQVDRANNDNIPPPFLPLRPRRRAPIFPLLPLVSEAFLRLSLWHEMMAERHALEQRIMARDSGRDGVLYAALVAEEAKERALLCTVIINGGAIEQPQQEAQKEATLQANSSSSSANRTVSSGTTTTSTTTTAAAQLHQNLLRHRVLDYQSEEALHRRRDILEPYETFRTRTVPFYKTEVLNRQLAVDAERLGAARKVQKWFRAIRLGLRGWRVTHRNIGGWCRLYRQRKANEAAKAARRGVGGGGGGEGGPPRLQ